jgi:hypothetical protein
MPDACVFAVKASILFTRRFTSSGLCCARKYPMPAPFGVPTGLVSFSPRRQSYMNRPTHNGLALAGISGPAGPCIRSKCLLRIGDLEIGIKCRCKNSLRHTICRSPCDNAVESCALVVVLLPGQPHDIGSGAQARKFLDWN